MAEMDRMVYCAADIELAIGADGRLCLIDHRAFILIEGRRFRLMNWRTPGSVPVGCNAAEYVLRGSEFILDVWTNDQMVEWRQLCREKRRWAKPQVAPPRRPRVIGA